MKINDVAVYLDEMTGFNNNEDEEVWLIAMTRTEFDIMLSNKAGRPVELTDEGWDAILDYYSPSINPIDVAQCLEDVHHQRGQQMVVVL